MNYNQEKVATDNAPAVKRPYHKPLLIEHGPVSKLTQGGQGSGADSGSQTGMAMVCL